MKQIYASNFTALTSMGSVIYGMVTLSNICLVVGLLAGIFSIYISWRQKRVMDKTKNTMDRTDRLEQMMVEKEKKIEEKEAEIERFIENNKHKKTGKH